MALPSTDELIHRRAMALAQHQRVMEEAARVARIAEQARNRRAATPVFAATGAAPSSVRARVNWVRAG